MAVRLCEVKGYGRHRFHGQTQGVGEGKGSMTIFKFCCARQVNWGGGAGIRLFPFGVI